MKPYFSEEKKLVTVYDSARASVNIFSPSGTLLIWLMRRHEKIGSLLIKYETLRQGSSLHSIINNGTRTVSLSLSLAAERRQRDVKQAAIKGSGLTKQGGFSSL